MEIDSVQNKKVRKQKEKVYGITKVNDLKSNKIDEHVILHLQLTLKQIENIDNDSILDFNNNNLTDPYPYDPYTHNPESNYSEINKIDNMNDNINNINNINNSNIINDNINNDNINGNIINDNIINDLTNNKNINLDNNSEEMAQIDDDINKKLVKRNLKNIMFEFLDGNNRKDWVLHTNICCLWCCHAFDSIPCAIPEKYVKGKFYLFGCFCSFNCCAAYIFDQKKYNMWDQYSLLNLLYRKMYNITVIKIKLAPPRQVLKMFGGFMTIEEFRKNFLTNISYQLVIPPMISLIPKVEENIYEHINAYDTDNKNNQMNEKKNDFNITGTIIDNGNNLKLKREKPKINTKMTLMSYMSES